MLFDLRGRRRRAVQVTYLLLAVLMGGGLVLFGIGGDVSGGLFDAISGNSGSGGNGNDVLEKRIDRQEERLGRDPRNEALMQSLVRDYYGLATAQQVSGSTAFPDDAKDELRRAAQYWQRYADSVDGDPTASTAQYALRIYDRGALNQPTEAQNAAAIIARQREDTQAYLQLVAYAGLAGDTRTADLAAEKAVDLAPKAQKKAVKQQAELLKKPQQQQQQPQG